MLNHIRIRNFAIIDHLDLEFKDGLTALTGETGAGKSILLGALGLLLGDRADSDSVRSGSSKAEISAEFDISKLDHVANWLKEKELDSDQDCLIRRRLSSDGRSRAFINGSPVPLQDMRELGEMLVDIHGQHEHQSLMKPQMQRQLLDDYANNKKPLIALKNIFEQWKKTRSEFEQLKNAADDRNDRIDLLRYQVQELDNLALAENEVNLLQEEHQRLANADRLLDVSQKALQAIYDAEDASIYTQLSSFASDIESASEVDHNLAPANDMLNEAMVQIEETASLLRDYLDRLESDPARFDEVETRLGLIHDLSRKHQIDAQQLNEVHQQLTQELDNLDHADENLASLEKKSNELEQQYLKQAKKLSIARSKAATALNKKISEAMQTLGMSGGTFEIKVQENSSGKYGIHGLDDIEFTVSANAGQACKSLAKVASGGELARISLAIQMITAQQGRIPTLIFDEVDSGVGGGIAEIVGRHLRALGESRQVFCVTHLPQVASQAHHHMQVQKLSENNETITQINSLTEQQRIEEISRMLGGVEITQQTRAHAEEMLMRSQQ
ncbi:MAG: DNA repair protein RecN [Gammaproteobacteria bacterium]|nr:DNA repair protein RecN [Gammaproteobacteria bacterium]